MRQIRFFVVTNALKNNVLFSVESQAIWVRRLILFFVMLMSGGHVFLPREPMLAIVLLLSFTVVKPENLIRPELGRIWIFLLLILVVSLIGATSFPVIETATRYANFLAGITIIAIYLDKPASQMMRDASPVLIFFSLQSFFTPIAAILFQDLFVDFVYDEVVYHTLAGLFTYHDVGAGEGGILGLKRPDGFFFEPGVMQIYLNLLLYIALFHRRSLMHAGLALAGIAATQSTTGMIIAVMLGGFAALNWIRKSQASVSILAVVIAPLALAPIAYLTYFNLIDKLFGAAKNSTTARSFDTETGILIIQNFPVFGIGFSKDRFREEFRNFGRTVDTILGDSALDRTMSNGLVHVMVVLGIPIFLLFVYAIFRQRLFNKSIVVSILVLLSMTTEALLLTPFFLAIAFSGLIAPRRVTLPRASMRRVPAVRPGVA